MRSIVIGGLLGGLVLFVWSAISWMVLPWHHSNFHKFDQEKVVEIVMQTNAPHKGIYLLPNPSHGSAQERKEAHERASKGPFAFVVMNPKGWGSMPLHMIFGLLIQIAGAGLVTGFLTFIKKPDAAYAEKFIFVVLFALAAGVVCQLPYWNWWGFPKDFILLAFADLLIGWSLAGLMIAKVA